MGVIDVIRQGNEATYQVEILHDGFDMERGEFCVTLTWGLMGGRMVFGRDEMVRDAEDRWYMNIDTSGMTGRVVAECVYYVDDGGRRQRYIDKQLLCFVAASACPRLMCCNASCYPEDRDVRYKLHEGHVDDYAYYVLRDCFSRDLITVDGNVLLVLKMRA
jgi:hypothetical protein